MTEDEIPNVISESSITIGGIDIKCFILEDGQRVLDAPSMDRFVAALESGKFAEAEAETLAKWIKGKLLQ